MSETKSVVASKTLWVNAAALAAMLAAFGLNVDVAQITAVAAVVLPVINVVLRFVTKQPLDLFGSDNG